MIVNDNDWIFGVSTVGTQTYIIVTVSSGGRQRSHSWMGLAFFRAPPSNRVHSALNGLHVGDGETNQSLHNDAL